MPNATLRLMRWQNALLAAAGVLAGAWWVLTAPGEGIVARDGIAALLGTRTILAAAAAIALAAFANITNDIADVEIDRIAHPDRPIAAGRLREETARIWAAVAGIAAVAASLAAWPALAPVSAVILLIMFEYSRWIKARGLPGNILVAIIASLPFLYGTWSAHQPAAAWPLLLVAIPLHLAREIAKDIEDVDGDATRRRTLPLAAGLGAARFGLLLALAAFAGALVPLAVERPAFAALVLPALVACAIAARRAFAGRRGGPLLLKTAMVWSLAALLLSSRPSL
ncbi:MAG: UbiA family prenyltransferase [Gemmatimonadaceae bacterium]